MTTIDLTIMEFLNYLRCEPLNIFFKFITHLGDYLNIWIIIGILVLVLNKYRKMGIYLIISQLGLSFINNVFVKTLLQRDRPCVINIESIVKCPDSFSMPSGHTLTSFAAATIIYQYNKFYGKLAYILASLIGISRIYLGVHYPSDVIIGCILGIGLIIIIFKKICR